MQITFRFRGKDKYVARRKEQAAAVNFVWNFYNEAPTTAVKAGRKWLDVDDLDRLIKGATKAGLDLHSQPVQKICEQFLHKETTKLVRQYGFIAVGNVSPSKLARTNMAKSVLDAGWSDLKTMLTWKSRIRGGGMCRETFSASG
jgi:transposase